jgi:hypothetical protein
LTIRSFQHFLFLRMSFAFANCHPVLLGYHQCVAKCFDVDRETYIEHLFTSVADVIKSRDDIDNKVFSALVLWGRDGQSFLNLYRYGATFGTPRWMMNRFFRRHQDVLKGMIAANCLTEEFLKKNLRKMTPKSFASRRIRRRKVANAN